MPVEAATDDVSLPNVIPLGGLATAIVHLASLLELKTNCCSKAFEHHPISWLSCSGMVILDTFWFLRTFSNLPLYIWDGFSVLKQWIEEITQAFFSEIWHHQDNMILIFSGFLFATA